MLMGKRVKSDCHEIQDFPNSTVAQHHSGSLYFILQIHIYEPLLLLMEKAMAAHSSTLAWQIPWTEEPGRLQSTGSLRVRHDWALSLSLFTFMRWRKKWQPTPVFLPGESHRRGSLVGCRLWGRTESEELMLLNCGVGEDSWESLGLQGDPTSPFWRSALGFLWKEWC